MRKNLTKIRRRDGLGFDPPKDTNSVWTLFYKARHVSVVIMAVLVLAATLVPTQSAQAQDKLFMRRF